MPVAVAAVVRPRVPLAVPEERQRLVAPLTGAALAAMEQTQRLPPLLDMAVAEMAVTAAAVAVMPAVLT
jgi:hypothetical protein